MLGANVREPRRRARTSAEGARVRAEVNVSAAAASIPLASGVTGKQRRAGKGPAEEAEEREE